MNWYKAALREAYTLFDEVERTKDEMAQIAQAALLGFDYLWGQVIKQAKIRDSFKGDMHSILPVSTLCHQRSKKMRIDFDIGIGLYGWELRCPIENAQYIGRVKDDFWEKIAVLGNMGAELEDCGCDYKTDVVDKTHTFLKYKGGLTYQVARDYTILELSHDFEKSFNTCLGSNIQVNLSLDADEDQVLGFYLKGADAMYRINYALYRLAYQRRKQIEKNMDM